MPSNNDISDDYVANLLAKDAKASTAKYSAYGFNAQLPKRPTTNAPRPNTRFLKNIIKETDSHNTALRAKEAEDAKARLRRLHGLSSSGSNLRDRRERWDDRDDGRLKRRRTNPDDDDDGRHERQQNRNKSSSDKRKEANSEDRRSPKRSRKADYSTDDEEEPSRSHRRRHRHHHRSHRRRSRDPSTERNPKSRKIRARTRSQTPRPTRSHSHRRSGRRRPTLSASPSSSANGPNTNPHKSTSTKNPPSSPPSASDSDPLSSLLGPPPPPKILPRGRGTIALTSGIDNHFSTSYDPTTDIPLAHNSDDDNDWDQALEALKDRQRWKKSGAERLRAAGFSEEEVGKWEGSSGGVGLESGERGVEDVRWRGRGEGREWDRGKVVGVDGAVETGAEWGRLKGT